MKSTDAFQLIQAGHSVFLTGPFDWLQRDTLTQFLVQYDDGLFLAANQQLASDDNFSQLKRLIAQQPGNISLSRTQQFLRHLKFDQPLDDLVIGFFGSNIKQPQECLVVSIKADRLSFNQKTNSRVTLASRAVIDRRLSQTEKKLPKAINQAFYQLITNQVDTCWPHNRQSQTWLTKAKVAQSPQLAKIAKTATTGLAATQLNGVSLNHWLGVRFYQRFVSSALNRNLFNRYREKLIRQTKVLIIDEAQRLKGFQFDLVDRICRRAKKSDQPFGGLQVILKGDFGRLAIFSGGLDSSLVYSKAWQNLQPKICYLDQPSAKLSRYQKCLLAIRANQTLTASQLDAFQDRLQVKPTESDLVTRLDYTNWSADDLNQRALADLINRPRHFIAEINGNSRQAINSLQRNCLAPKNLILKKGALVVFVKDDFAGRYRQGTLGRVVGFGRKSDQLVKVAIKHHKTEQVRVINVGRVVWRADLGDRQLATYQQLPLRLAWAVTVHKSRHMLFDDGLVNLDTELNPGLAYLALVRLTSFQGLYLDSFNPQALKMDPDLVELDQSFQKQSQQ